jgi:hypothetical protein
VAAVQHSLGTMYDGRAPVSSLLARTCVGPDNAGTTWRRC